MASHVVVIATDLRRTTIKVTPATYLTDVLQEACRKLNISSDSYLIKHKQKQVDLSVPFRTSGLIGGAKLELVQKSKTPSAIQVALQVPLPEGKEIPGGRLIHKFPSDLSLWKVLRQFESGIASNGRNVNVTARGVAKTAAGSGTGGGQLYYETPVLNIMGREFASFPDFQKTLSQLGYNSGSVLIRLTFKGTDQTLFEAMEQIGRFFKDEEAQSSSTAQPVGGQAQKQVPDTAPQAETTPQPPTNATQPQESLPQTQPPVSTPEEPHSDPMQIDSSNTADPSSSKDPYQPVNVFLAPSGTTPAAALAPPEDIDYTPTIAHAQLHQARLAENSRNKRLPSDRELEERAAAEQARLAAITSVLVKVRFPDNTSSDWRVGTNETGAFLYEAVRHVAADATHPFHLVLPGEKTVIKDDASPRHSLIKGYKLSGRVLVSLVWDDNVPPEARKGPFLKANVAQRGQAVKVPEMPQVVEEKEDTNATPAPPKPEKSSGEDGGKKKVPKWLKLGKK